MTLYLSTKQHLPHQNMLKTHTFHTLDLQMSFAPRRCALFRHRIALEPSKSGPTPGALNMFTSKRASRHNDVHFFDISTSKSRPNVTVFDTFYFQMCFGPQRPALFRPCNIQKPSEPDSFGYFLLQNVLHSTTACTFSTLQLPKALRT